MRNTLLKYESSIIYHSKVIAGVKVFCENVTLIFDLDLEAWTRPWYKKKDLPQRIHM